jgi:DNA-binding winged helix-turn-helix (wHTH) protein
MDTLDGRESCGTDDTRVLVLTDERKPSAALVQTLRAQGLWLEFWDYRSTGLPASLSSPVDVVMVFGHAASRAASSALRRCNPDVFFAFIADDPNDPANQRWMDNGFDGHWSLNQPHEHIAKSVVAAARFARRVREAHQQKHRAGSLTLDSQTRTAQLNGRRIELTAYEFSLLFTLAQHLGSVLSRQELLERAKGSADEAFDRSIDVQVSRLRAKLGDNPRRPSLLKTVRGKGYVLVPGTLEP